MTVVALPEVEALFEVLDALCAQGGPEPHAYQALNEHIARVHPLVTSGTLEYSRMRRTLDDLGAPFSVGTMQGLALRKPRGYAGDFEMIEKIYAEHVSDEPGLSRWDRYFQSHLAPQAVRNRKEYFHGLLDALPRGARVLKLGVGPGRSMYEWFERNPQAEVEVECVDIDADAVDYARSLNAAHAAKIVFHNRNVFRFEPLEGREYQLIWAAGLFDYFDDRTFVALAKRFFARLAPGGALVIGNFSTENPTRPYMELIGDWHLHHRDRRTLESLGRNMDEGAEVSIGMEPAGVNLFLHVRRLV